MPDARYRTIYITNPIPAKKTRKVLSLMDWSFQSLGVSGKLCQERKGETPNQVSSLANIDDIKFGDHEISRAERLQTGWCSKH
jgi:hypothetical protein